jgi:hypothetical protein
MTEPSDSELVARQYSILRELDEHKQSKAALETEMQQIATELQRRLDAEREAYWVEIMTSNEAADRFVRKYNGGKFVPWTRQANYKKGVYGHIIYWPPDTPNWVCHDERQPMIMRACCGAIINQTGSRHFHDVLVRYLRRRRYNETDPHEIRQFIKVLLDRLVNNWAVKRGHAWFSQARSHHLHRIALELADPDYAFYRGTRRWRDDTKTVVVEKIVEKQVFVVQRRKLSQRSDRIIADAVRGLGLIKEQKK